MYNRYIPQPDGSFQRSRVEDRAPEKKIQPPEPSQGSVATPEQFIPRQDPRPCPAMRPRSQRPPYHIPQRQRKQEENSNSVSSFLKQLLPKDFDTADLMIVLLLLIMSDDCAEDQNTALLTLVLYLFM